MTVFSRRRMLAAAAALSIPGCRVSCIDGQSRAPTAVAKDAPVGGRISVYTSAYPHVVDAWKAVWSTLFPALQVDVFQAGSEKIAQRLAADREANGAGCDVLLASDPFLTRQLQASGLLRPHASPFATPLDRSLVDDSNAFVAVRVGAMVFAYNERTTKKADVPTSWQTLLSTPQRAATFAFGDPLSSGTYLTTIAVLCNGDDPSFLKSWKLAGADVGGGNSAVLQRVLTGERATCAVLLENVLSARRRGEPVAFVVPDDGAVLVPGDACVMAATQNPRAATALVDALLQPDCQRIIANDGDMYAAQPAATAPAGAPALASLLSTRPLDRALLARVAADRTAFLVRVERALS
jgi:iron(III) transport system substrate-binding protein